MDSLDEGRLAINMGHWRSEEPSEIWAETSSISLPKRTWKTEASAFPVLALTFASSSFVLRHPLMVLDVLLWNSKV